MRFAALVLLGCCVASAGAQATETVAYSYDAKGRLTQVAHSGGPANGAVATYRYDAADNRTRKVVTGAPGNVVVVPLNGLQVIVLAPPDG